jgi:hypothetical protein
MPYEIQKMLDQTVTLPLWPETGSIMGLSRNSTYAAAGRGEIKTIRIGRLLKVPTAWLRRKLELDPPETAPRT